MAKTTFIDGDKQQGVLGTRVTANFLNSVFSHRHTGQDDDGHAPLDYAAATGASNAYAITLTPPLLAYTPGLPITFLANHTNTGSSTLNIDGLGAKGIRNVNQNLAANQIQSGQLVTVMYDGVYFQMISAMRIQDSLYPLYTSRGSLLARGSSTSSGLETIVAAAVGNYLKSAGVNTKPVMGKLALSDTGIAIGTIPISAGSITSINVTTGFRPSVVFFMTEVHAANWACISVGFSNGGTIDDSNLCIMMVIGSGSYYSTGGIDACFCVQNSAGDAKRDGKITATSATGFTLRQEPAGLLLSCNLYYCALP